MTEPDERLHIVIPIFNDWGVVALLLPKLDEALRDGGLSADDLLVDDGSTQRADGFECGRLEAIGAVNVLELRRNLGHQRAIAVGLTYVQQHLPPRSVVVMDGDGEDAPADIVRLVTKLRAEGSRKIVFAERTRRSEPILFKIFYRLYRLLHVLLTGHHVRVGNFSVIPVVALSRLVVISEMWNHYAAAVYNARIDHTSVPTSRAKRLGGQSHMNFISLVVHGLSALSVYAHVIGVRLLVVASIVTGGAGVMLLSMLGWKLWSVTPLPDWLPGVVALLVILLVQGITAAFVFVFVMLSGRQGASVIPLRDYGHYVQGFVQVAPKP